MSKGNNLQSLFCGILFCISITALIIACLAFTKKGGGKGEYYKGAVGGYSDINCIIAAADVAVKFTSPDSPQPSPMQMLNASWKMFYGYMEEFKNTGPHKLTMKYVIVTTALIAEPLSRRSHQTQP